MRIAIAHHVRDADYIRHARTETLKAVGVEPNPSLIEPVPCGIYVFAYDDAGQPIGMGESAMFSEIYESYEDTPYASLGDLSSYCPLNQMASMRTVYVEPEYRNNSSLFLALTLGSAQLFYSLGARFATATTCGEHEYLNRLYEKWCGERVGTYCTELTSEPSSLFVFDLKAMLGHRVMRRVSRSVSFELGNELDAASNCLVA